MAQGTRFNLARVRRAVKIRTYFPPCTNGAIAQLGERIVRNDEVVGSIPTSSTMSNPFVSVTYSLPAFHCTVLYRRILTELSFCLTFFPVLMHLFVYTRHAPNCSKRADRFWRRCRCPKWIRGILDGKAVRVAAWTTDWECAEAKAHEMEQPLHPQAKVALVIPDDVRPKQRITIQEAVEAFLDDEQGRQLRKGTSGQSKTLLRNQLIPWAKEQRLHYLDELTVSVLSRFRAHWSRDRANGQNTARRKHERLCGFFHFCIRSEWMDKNPARLLKPVKVHRVPTGYYTRDEFARIIDATHAYGNWKGGHDFHHRSARLRALLLLMRWGGLSIH